MLPLVSFQCPYGCGLVPLTCAAGGTWLGCRWRGLGDDDPRWSCGPQCVLPYQPELSEVSFALLTPLDRLGARLCLPPPPPPPPFPVQPYLSRYTPDQRESIFVVVPLSLSPSVTPGLGLVDLLTSVRDPFHVYPPHSYAMLVFHSHPSPKSAFSGDQRSVGEPAPRARTTRPRLPCLLTTGPTSIKCFVQS